MKLPWLSSRYGRGGLYAAAPAAPSSAHEVTRQDDLSHWWKMDDLTDSTGNGASLTLNNHDGSFDSDAKNGSSVALDGTNEYISTSTTVDLGGDGSVMSASFWLKSQSVQTNPDTRYDGGYNELFGFGTAANTSTGHAFTVGTYPYTGSYMELRMRVGTTNKYYYPTYTGFSDIPSDLRDWHHWAFTWASGGGIKVYINATLAYTSSTFSGTIANRTSAYLRLGRNWAGTQCNPLKYDDVRLYGVELSGSDVSDIYGSGDGDWE